MARLWDFGRSFYRRVMRDDVGAYAAALTYSLLFALFPLALALAALLPNLPVPVSGDALALPPALVPREVTGLFLRLAAGPAHRPALAYAGAAGYVWGMSGAFRRLIDAVNHAYEYAPQLTRPAWKTFGLSLVLAVTLGLALVAAIVLATAGEHLVRLLIERTAGGPVAAELVSLLRWVLLLALGMAVLGVLYWVAPDRRRRFRWLSPGALTALAVWLAISAGFSLYLSHFNSYNLLYGSVGAFILLLLYLYILSYALLVGAEINALLDPGPAPPQPRKVQRTGS